MVSHNVSNGEQTVQDIRAGESVIGSVLNYCSSHSVPKQRVIGTLSTRSSANFKQIVSRL